MGHRLYTNGSLRCLLRKLLLLPLTAANDIDFAAEESSLFVAVGDDSFSPISGMHQGISAVGLLLAHSTQPLEDCTLSADSIESLGYLLGDLGDVSACLQTMAVFCRQHF